MRKKVFVLIGLLGLGACQYNEGPDQIAPPLTGAGGGGGTGGQTQVTLPLPDGGVDGINILHPPPPTATWMEHWFEHVQLLKLIDQDDNVVVYFDGDMKIESKAWITPYLSRLWGYTKRIYGVPGDDRLYAVFHAGRYNGGHSTTVFDPTHDYHNMMDVGGAIDAWTTPDLGLITQSAGQVLEGASHGIERAPSAALTSYTFGQIYTYDALRAMGMTADADKMLAAFNERTQDSPRAGTHWFRDWYYPIWADGGAAVFGRYYDLLYQRYPKIPRPDGRGATYAPAMNWGEYIHFMSGAAGHDLKPLATAAFGWPEDREGMYQRAKQDFPAITYKP